MFTYNLVILVSDHLSRYQLMISFNKGVWKLFMVIPGPEHQDHTLESSSWIIVLDRVNLKMEDRQEDLGILSVFRSICKDQIVDMLKCTTYTSFMFWILVFMNRLIKTSLLGFMYSRCILSIHACLNFLNKLILIFLLMF